MSEISRELQEQQDKDIGAAFKKIFGDIPVISEEDRMRIAREKIDLLGKRIDAEKTKSQA